MAKCYLCGRPIAPTERAVRRRVKTGEWVRRGYPRYKIRATQISYGQRVVCFYCARSLDLYELRKDLRDALKVFAAITILYLLFILGSLF